MDEDATEEALSVFPDAEYEVLWGEGAQLMVIKPVVPWAPVTFYEITLSDEAMSAAGLNMEEEYTFVLFTAEEEGL